MGPRGNLFKLIFLSLLISVGLGLHIVEGLMPIPFTVPGAKLGLANIVTVLALMLFGFKEAIIVAAMRSTLGILLGGAPSGILFSVSGAIVSTILMGVVYKVLKDNISVMGISVLGAVAHNITQLLVASLIVKTFGVFVYLPVLLFLAIPTGIFVGLSAILALRPLRSHMEKLI